MQHADTVQKEEQADCNAQLLLQARRRELSGGHQEGGKVEEEGQAQGRRCR